MISQSAFIFQFAEFILSPYSNICHETKYHFSFASVEVKINANKESLIH